ncbi:TPA: hypothetical protein EYP70_06300, partial [Candidatus Bathyarchaeota archaeon]|nr:hypothetical protein [Candidatus Bathyarchaeota archaeon]
MEIDLLTLIPEVIKERYRYIVFVVSIVTITAIVISLVWPPTYEAYGLLAPNIGTTSPYTELANNVRLRLFYILRGSGLVVSDVFARILRSRRIQETVIRKCDLMNVYNVNNLEDAIDHFEKDTNIEVGWEGFITLSAKASTAELAAKITNEWIKALDNYLHHMQRERGKAEKKFVQKQLTEVAQKLKKAQDSLKNFLTKHGLIEIAQVEDTLLPLDNRSINAQISKAMDIYYDFSRRLMTKEVTLNIYSRWEKEHPMIQQLRNEIDALTSRTKTMVFSKADSGLGPGFSSPLIHTPLIQKEYRILRNSVTIYSSLKNLLEVYLELSRIEESRNLPLIEVIDWAKPPDRRSWPQRKLIVIAAIASSFLISLLICIAEKQSS